MIPTLNFAENKLTLRSTRESCSQCFANLRQPEGVYKHYISTKSKAKNNEEIKLNTYVSLKIEETIANGESTVTFCSTFGIVHLYGFALDSHSR